MEFGLFSLSLRGRASAAESWEEDLLEIALAEELGFQETWVAEHIGGFRPDAMPAADLFICKAAGLTQHMRFGPGVRALPYHHPITVAMQAAVCDHLTGGRYMAGFGGGRGAAGRDYFRQFGVDADASDKRQMMHEAIEFILRCWTETEPFDFHGNFWQGEGITVQPKPLQQPRMPVGLANSESISTAQLAGAKGFLPLHAYYDLGSQLRELSAAFLEAGYAAGREPSRSDIRVSRIIHVADSVRLAKEEARDSLTALIEQAKRTPERQHLVRSLPPGGDVEDISFEYLVDSGVFLVGDPDNVYQRAREFYDEVGGFGLLLITAGRPIGTWEQRERSWRLFAKHVAPRLRALDPAPAGN